MPVDRLFLSVGAIKAGTTFLYLVFRQHPEIYFTPEKEVHFFAHTNGFDRRLHRPIIPSRRDLVRRAAIRRGTILSNDFRRHRLSQVLRYRYERVMDAAALRRNLQWYADRYLVNPVDDAWFERIYEDASDRYAADFSNYHALLPTAGWNHVKRMTRDLRVLYVLRDPIERLWSHIKFELIQSGRRERLDSLGVEDLNSILRASHVSAHARFGDVVEHLRRNLDERQLLIVTLEDFVGDFPRSAKEIERFLGVEEHRYQIDPSRKRNPTEPIPIPPNVHARLREVTHPQIEKLQRLGVHLPQGYFT